ncbi:MAG TPA: hypothetical protein V6C52_06965 [Coleofasciculaceae cyanobacterium]
MPSASHSKAFLQRYGSGVWNASPGVSLAPALHFGEGATFPEQAIRRDQKQQPPGILARAINQFLKWSGLCFYYGTFNPLQYAHIQNAIQARRKGYKHVVFLIAKDPAHKKSDPDLLPASARTTMARIGVKDYKGLHVLPLDSKKKCATGQAKGGKVSWLEKLVPAGTEIPMIIGEDALQDRLPEMQTPFALERLKFLVSPMPTKRPNANHDGGASNAASESSLPLTVCIGGQNCPLNAELLTSDQDEGLKHGYASVHSKLIRNLMRHTTRARLADKLLPPELAAHIRKKGYWQSPSKQSKPSDQVVKTSHKS